MAAVQSQAGPSALVSDLRKSIEAHDETFTKLLSLIPAQYYIVDTPEEVSSIYVVSRVPSKKLTIQPSADRPIRNGCETRKSDRPTK